MVDFKKIQSCFNCYLKDNLFCYMTDEQLSFVDKTRQEVIFKPGETIFKTGSPLTHIICITKGMVKIYLEDNRANKNIIIGIGKSGQLISDPGFLVDNVHHFTIVALEETSVCFVQQQDFREVMESNIDFSMEMVKLLNKQIIDHYDRIVSLTNKRSTGKVADVLLYLTNVIYESDSFEMLLSRQDIADLSTINKESAIRVLKDFENDSIITFEGNHIKILDKDNLINISKNG